MVFKGSDRYTSALLPNTNRFVYNMYLFIPQNVLNNYMFVLNIYFTDSQLSDNERPNAPPKQVLPNTANINYWIINRIISDQIDRQIDAKEKKR